MFRSNSFKRSETELVIIVTPYLVKPVSAGQIALPTDGYKGATDFQRLIGGQSFDGKSGEKRPAPRMAPPVTSPPSVDAIGKVGSAEPEKPAAKSADKPKDKKTAAVADPGFSFN